MNIGPVKRLSALLLGLLATLGTVLLAPSPAAADEGADEVSVLERSWPAEGTVFWVPIREGSLMFREPVDAQTVTMTLYYENGSPEPMDRLTTGDSVTTVLFRVSVTRPGVYKFVWEATTTAGVSHEGTVNFAFERSEGFVGGQNHRHGETAHLVKETSRAFALRLLFVLPIGLLLGAYFNQRLRGSSGLLSRWTVRAGGGMLAVAALTGAIVDIANNMFTYHDYPLSAAVSAPGFVLFPVMAALAGYLLFTGRAGVATVAAAVGVASARAGLGHPVGGFDDIMTIVAYAVTMLGAGATWAFAVTSALASPEVGRRGSRRLWAAVAVTVVASFTMLLLHARTFDLRVDFADDLRFRTIMAATACGGALLSLLRPKSRKLRVPLGTLAGALVIVATAALLWMPPPAAGL